MHPLPMSPSFSGIPDVIGLPATLSLDTSLRRLIELRYSITRDLGSPDDFCKASLVGTSGHVFTIMSRKARMASLPLPFFVPSFLGAALATGAFLAMAFFGVDFVADCDAVDMASSLS